MEQPRSALNRISLATSGLVLLAGGGWLVATRPALASRLPGWWPTAEPGSVLLDREGLADLRTHGWWTPTVMAGSVLLTLLLAVWCLSRFRSGGRSLSLFSADGTVRSGALADAVARRTSSLAGVSRCRVDVRARRTRLYVRTHIWLSPDVAPAVVLTPLAGLRAEVAESAAPYRIVSRVRISTRTHRTPHVR